MDSNKVKSDWKNDFAHYQKCMEFLGANVPVETLCLPTVINTILHREKYDTVHDLLRVDVFKIKGLGKSRCSLLTSRLDQFVSINL